MQLKITGHDHCCRKAPLSRSITEGTASLTELSPPTDRAERVRGTTLTHGRDCHLLSVILLFSLLSYLSSLLSFSIVNKNELPFWLPTFGLVCVLILCWVYLNFSSLCICRLGQAVAMSQQIGAFRTTNWKGLTSFSFCSFFLVHYFGIH